MPQDPEKDLNPERGEMLSGESETKMIYLTRR